jgi:outer membrane receptor protein involved in Fe transport
VQSILAILVFTSLSGKIQGTVKDEVTGQPIPYANVIIIGAEIGAATDESGNFYILSVIPDTYTVEVSCIGYQTKIIENVIIEVNQTSRLNVNLKETPIEVRPIIVTDERPAVTKDMVSKAYIIRKDEIAHLPVDYTTHLISLQPSVATMDTALHVRGGRATEVLYMIDNVSIINPQTGDPAITFSKGIIDEVIFMPGAFDAEYGRAMSGVINAITAHPSDNLQGEVYGKTERVVPFYYDFGYENLRSSIHLPLSRKSKGLLSFDIMHIDDWDPRVFELPHKERDDYAVYGKWLFAPSGKMRISLSGAQSRTQFDRYQTYFKFHLDHMRSDMRRGNFQALNVDYLPDSRKLIHITLGRLYAENENGVREPGPYGIFDDFVFRDYLTLQPPLGGYMNPFGVYSYEMRVHGDWPEYQYKTSQVLNANLKADLQIHKYHELIVGFQYIHNDLQNFTYFLSGDILNPITDEWHYKPKEISLYLQDNIDYQGLYAKLGCRYDYFSNDIAGIEPKSIISPRVGFSFMVTDKFLFRANIGRYTQPPLYDYMYRYYNLLPFPGYMQYLFGFLGGVIGNPDLGPEKTMSYEIGLQGEIRKNVSATLNVFYKDVTNLIGTHWDVIGTSYYISYFNTEYANIKGMEAILELSNNFLTGKISYTLSWTRGTSSYANTIYRMYYLSTHDTVGAPPAQEYYLDFDQRHRIFVQGTCNFPSHTQLHLFGYLGNGFPYTPPGAEGKYEERNIALFPFRKQIDCVISRSFFIGKISLHANLEIVNLLNERTQIADHAPLVDLEVINPANLQGGMSITNGYYHPAMDLNHDGYVAAHEHYTSYIEFMKATDDWPSAYTAPRRTRIGISINF